MLKKLYDKNEMSFALLMIVIYIAGTVLAETATAIIGIKKLIPAIFHLAMTAVLFYWIIRNDPVKKYGLIKPDYPMRKVWYFLPLIIVACFGLLGGIEFRYSAAETFLFVLSMTCVGFLEEIIFRGFLFIGLLKDGSEKAIVISSVTFGIGHIVNLISGAPLFGTLMQIIFATVVGYTLVMLFYKGKSLIPCIVFHSLNNSLSVIERDYGEVARMLSVNETIFELTCVMFFVLLLTVYRIVCLRKLGK